MRDDLCEENFRSLEIAKEAFLICPEKPEVFRKNVPCGTILGKNPEHELGVLLIDTHPQFIANPQGGRRIGQDRPVFEGNQILTGGMTLHNRNLQLFANGKQGRDRRISKDQRWSSDFRDNAGAGKERRYQRFLSRERAKSITR